MIFWVPSLFFSPRWFCISKGDMKGSTKLTGETKHLQSNETKHFHVFHNFWIFVIFYWVHRSFWHSQSRDHRNDRFRKNLELVRKKILKLQKSTKLEQNEKTFFWKKSFWPREWPRHFNRNTKVFKEISKRSLKMCKILMNYWAIENK